jgi:class 3 adenylate cyclase/tetratricopeptide (TPR) repeat protein
VSAHTIGPTTKNDGDDRRQATVLFADLSNFSATSRRMDPEDLKSAINDCFQVIERIVGEHGGTIDKYIGDCVMALFGAPAALEHAPQHAINAAIAIRAGVEASTDSRFAGPLRVHIGINTGLVAAGQVGGNERRDYTVMGEAVNLASRLQSEAKDGQILVGETTYKAAAHEFRFRPLTVRLKGYDEPVAAFEVLSTTLQPFRARPASPEVAKVPMLGRDAELARIASIVESLRSGAGNVVAVIGENGMGKSRLLAEVLALPAVGDLTIVEGRCMAVGTGLAFHPFVDLLRSWCGVGTDASSMTVYQAFVARLHALELDNSREILAAAARLLGVSTDVAVDDGLGDLEGEALERVIRDAFSRLFAAVSARKPLLFVVEDVHWSDHASTRLLASVLPLVKSSPIGFLLLGRPHYAETTDRIVAFITEELPGSHAVVRLRPLSTASTGELITRIAGRGRFAAELVSAIGERTEGNPFYVEEVVRDLIERSARGTELSPAADLPVTIEGVIRARIERAEPDARRVLQIAAVVGRTFDRDIVAELVSESVDVDRALDELVQMDLLTAATSRSTASRRVVRMSPRREYAFRHALIQEAAYSSIVRKTCREIHAACVTIIERQYAGRLQDAYGMLAYHCLRAENLEKAEEYTFKAGEMAARTAASHEALRYFREAYRVYQAVHGERGDAAKRALLETHIAEALFHTGNLGESVEHFDAALALYGQWLPRSTLSRWVKFSCDLAGLLARLYAGKHRAGRDREQRTHAIGEILYDRARAENPTDPIRYVFDTIAAARYVQRLDLYDCRYACEITATTGAFFTFGGLSVSVARRFLDEAASLVKEKGSSDEFSLRAMGTVVEYQAGDWSGRYDIDDQLMEQGLRSGRLWAADTYLGMLAERSSRQGRFAHARAQIARLRELRLEYGYEFAASAEAAQTAFCLLEEGNYADALGAMRSYYEMRKEDGLHVLALSGMAKLHALRGEFDTAEESLRRASQIVRRSRRLSPYYMGAYRTTLLMVAVMKQRPGARWTELRTIRRLSRQAIATSRFVARDRAEALRWTARSARVAGRADKALETFGRAFDEAARLDALPEMARICAEIARCLEDAASVRPYRDRDALGWRTRSAEMFTRLGLVGEAAAVLPALAQAGAAVEAVEIRNK